MADDIAVHTVQLNLCDLCIRGEGGECHVPGCSMWINRAPDLPLDTHPSFRVVKTADHLALLSRWIDEHPANAERDREAATWGRLAKVSEEAGEVIEAMIGATGQNPRKGFSHGIGDVGKELLDVAVTALAAYEHLTGNQEASVEALERHLEGLLERAEPFVVDGAA